MSLNNPFVFSNEDLNQDSGFEDLSDNISNNEFILASHSNYLLENLDDIKPTSVNLNLAGTATIRSKLPRENNILRLFKKIKSKQAKTHDKNTTVSRKQKKINLKKSQKRNEEYPKKEYYIFQLFRLFNKYFKKLNQISSRVEQSDEVRRCPERLKKFLEFEEFCLENRSALNLSFPNPAPSSINNGFIREFFSSDIAKEGFVLLCDYLFTVESKSDLVKLFNFECCHSLNCKSHDLLWDKLLEFTVNDLINPKENQVVHEEIYIEENENQALNMLFY